MGKQRIGSQRTEEKRREEKKRNPPSTNFYLICGGSEDRKGKDGLFRSK
jgi:hypothetical protein